MRNETDGDWKWTSKHQLIRVFVTFLSHSHQASPVWWRKKKRVFDRLPDFSHRGFFGEMRERADVKCRCKKQKGNVSEWMENSTENNQNWVCKSKIAFLKNSTWQFDPETSSHPFNCPKKQSKARKLIKHLFILKAEVWRFLRNCARYKRDRLLIAERKEKLNGKKLFNKFCVLGATRGGFNGIVKYLKTNSVENVS